MKQIARCRRYISDLKQCNKVDDHILGYVQRLELSAEEEDRESDRQDVLNKHAKLKEDLNR